MKRVVRKLCTSQQGNVAVLVGLSLMVLMAMTGLVIDGGILYMTKSHLQKTANAAVLSAAQELVHEEEDVSEVVNEVLQYHKEEESLEKVDIQKKDKLTVHLGKEVPLHFMRIFGKEMSMVRASAAAEILSMGRAQGVVPLGIEDTINLIPGVEYTLKVDEEDVETGNFGALALGTPGAKSYLQNLMYGYDEEIKIGDILDTEPGNNVGPTQEGIDYRINNDLYPGEIHKDSSRLILVPLYTTDGPLLGKDQITITGFTYFYVTERVDSKDKTIKGKFIEMTGAGFYEEGNLSKGAYVIRLTE